MILLLLLLVSPHLVFTTSTGLATAVAVTPASSAAARWQGTPSPSRPLARIASFAASYTTAECGYCYG